MDYRRALEYLEHIEKLGIRLGLRNTGTIINHLPFNREGMRIIQVAGTNGKGSVARFLAAVLRAAGFRTGLFTSPHLHDVRERIIIDNEWISESRFAEAVSAVEAVARTLADKKQIAGMPPPDCAVRRVAGVDQHGDLHASGRSESAASISRPLRETPAKPSTQSLAPLTKSADDICLHTRSSSISKSINLSLINF